MTTAKTRLIKLLQRIDVDRAVFFGIVAKLWNFAAGPITAVIIATQFSLELQGYYYTFGSLLALQSFAELGLGTVIQQFASHEWSKLSFDQSGQIIGDKDALSRLVSLARAAIKWYTITSIIAGLGLCFGGYIFFDTTNNQAVNWTLPWFALCIVTAMNIFLIPVGNILEGCNQVSKTYPFNFVQVALRTLSMWIAMTAGAKLWTVAIAAMVGLIALLFFYRIKYFNFIKTLFFTKLSGPRLNWNTDILPMQWRIAVSWSCDYFIFFLFTPVLFKYQGAAQAGKMGMTWTMVGFVASISSMWLYPRVPGLAMLIAQKRYHELDVIFFKLLKTVLAVAVIIAFAIFSLVYGLNITKFFLADRLLTPFPTFLLLAGHLLFATTLPFAYYMRAHKMEPLMPFSILAALMVAFFTLVLGKYYYATGMAFGYLFTQLIYLTLIILFWYRFRLKWHVDSKE